MSLIKKYSNILRIRKRSAWLFVYLTAGLLTLIFNLLTCTWYAMGSSEAPSMAPSMAVGGADSTLSMSWATVTASPGGNDSNDPWSLRIII